MKPSTKPITRFDPETVSGNGRETTEPSSEPEDRLSQIGTRTREVVHDLLNPLASIEGLGQLLLAVSEPEGESGRQMTHCTQLLLAEADRIRLLAENLLSYARDGDDPVTLKPAQWQPFLEEEVGPIISSQLWPSGIELQLELDDADPEDPQVVAFDKLQLLRIFDNLARNACQAMPDGGWVRLESRRDGDEVVVRLTDSGPGIPEETRCGLFNPLSQGNEARGQLGLGLSIAQRIAEAHHGRLKLEPAVPDEGATFRLTLPLADPATEADCATPIRVTMTDGQRLIGAIPAAPLELVTALGSLRLAQADVGGVEATGEEGTVRVWLRDGSEYLGRWKTGRRPTMELAVGDEVHRLELPMERLERLQLKREATWPDAAVARVITTAGDDFLIDAGRSHLVVENDLGCFRPAFAEIAVLSPPTNATGIWDVELANGTRLRGRVPEEELTLRPRLGPPEIQVPVDTLLEIRQERWPSQPPTTDDSSGWFASERFREQKRSQSS